MKNDFRIISLMAAFVMIILVSGCKKKETIPSLTTAPLNNITFKTATSGGTITDVGDSDIIRYGVCWSTSRNPTNNDSTSFNETPMLSFESNITGLLDNTKYYVRAFATNSTGIGYGNEIPFTTNDTPVFSFSYDINNSTHVPTLIDVVEFFDELHISTQIGDTTLTVIIPADFTTGNHTFGVNTDYEATYEYGSSMRYFAILGMINITDYDPVTLKMNAVFDFTGEEISGGGTVQITNGEFVIFY